MAEPLSSQTAEKIAALKAQQQQVETENSNLKNSIGYQEALAKARAAQEELNSALDRQKATPTGSPGRDEALQAATDATIRSRQATEEFAILKKQSLALESESARYERDIQSTAAVQTTSPEPGLDEQVAEAKKDGAAVEKQPLPNPIPTDTPTPPPVEPYNPSTEPVFVFNQSQINYLEAYNQNLIDGGNEDLIISDLTSGEALTLLSEQGLIEDVSPDDQQTIEGGDQDLATGPPRFVNIRGVLGDPAIDSQVVETFPIEDQQTLDGDPAIDSQVVETFPIEEQQTIDGDPAIDSQVVEIFPEDSDISTTTISSLPTRNQQMAVASPKDWRFRISLSPSANYLYKDANPGILRPLQATNGVIYPYTPSITVNYVANYSSSELTHSNYKIYNYKNSSVETINIVGDFTVQDSAEANYVLAVIHFFKSVTKMFYGQDQNPIRGTPPPLVYLTGFGQYQFDMHPVVITNFTHTFPTDVDYVNAYPTNNSSAIGGQNMQPYMPQIAQFISPLDRLRTLGSKIRVGGTAPPPTFINSQNINEVTRVPSKINIQLTCLPIVTRNAVSNTFSLRKYASGELMRGSVNFGRTGGGMW
jgi:hypothetical protein